MSHSDTIPLNSSSQSDIDEIEDPGKALKDWDLWGPLFFIVFLGLTLSWSASVKKGTTIVPTWRAFRCICFNAKVFALKDSGLGKPLGTRIVLHWSMSLGFTMDWLIVYYARKVQSWLINFSRAQSEVFDIAFALLAAGAVILTLNVLLLGGHIIFFQSLGLLGYCLFPLDIGALICMVKDNVIVKIIVVVVTLAWSSWAAYPFMSSAVNPRRKALALYHVLLMYGSVGFLIIAID